MNVTLRIPDELGKKAKHLAIDEGKSLSAMITELLEQRLRLSDPEAYQASQKKAWEIIERGVSGGGERFSRESIYDRHS